MIDKNLCPSCFREITDGKKCSRCGYIFNSDEDHPLRLPVFTILHGRYLIGRLLGYGGFGITYAAMDIETNELCAIKEFMPAELISGRLKNHALTLVGGTDRSFENGRKRFINEARTLYQLRENTSVVNVRDFFEENTTAYFVMEMLDGVTLGRLIKYLDIGRLQKFAMTVALTAANTIQLTHDVGILHRDLSPDNIFITCDMQVKIIDFGSAKCYIAGQSANSRSMLLKPGFAPPEQYSTRGHQGPWTDIYALAATYYYAVSGVMVPDAMARIEGDNPIPLADMEINISRAISDVIVKALSLNASERYQSMSEFASALREASGIDNDALRQPSSRKNDTELTERVTDTVTGKAQVIILEVLSGSMAGSGWVLTDDTEVSVGRVPPSPCIIIKDAKISRRHCTIRCSVREKSVFLTDHSTNGTYLKNGSRLTKNVEYRIHPGDEFYLSSPELRLRVTIL